MYIKYLVISAPRNRSPLSPGISIGSPSFPMFVYCPRRCHDCHVTKRTPTAQYGLAKPLPTAQCPWSIISMDFMNLSTSEDDSGNKYDAQYVRRRYISSRPRRTPPLNKSHNSTMTKSIVSMVSQN
jgi:hypothetical protein